MGTEPTYERHARRPILEQRKDDPMQELRDAAKVLQHGRLLRKERGHEEKRRHGKGDIGPNKGKKDKDKNKAGGEG